MTLNCVSKLVFIFLNAFFIHCIIKAFMYLLSYYAMYTVPVFWENGNGGIYYDAISSVEG